MNKLFSMLILCSFASLYVLSKDLGVYGTTFDIKETDAIEMMKKKMLAKKASGEIDIRNQLMSEKLKEKAVRPTPSFGITRATSTRTFFYDPSISFGSDFKGKDDGVFYKAGTKVNPLNHIKFDEKWLFLNGDDKEQVEWALSLSGNTVLILTSGSPAELMKEHGVRFFFDQNSMFTRKFGIRCVPAVLEISDNRLSITELGEL